jgi:hypothetical protein
MSKTPRPLDLEDWKGCLLEYEDKMKRRLSNAKNKREVLKNENR